MRLSLSLAIALMPALARADVLHVGPPGSGLAHTTIQSAIDAAAPGDTILVRTGTYAGFVLDGKGLVLSADARARVKISGTVEIRNVPLSGVALLTDLHIEGTRDNLGLHVASCAGYVRLQSSTLVGGFGWDYTGWATPGRPAALVEASPRVAFIHSKLVGGIGGGWLVGTTQGGRGGDSLVMVDSAVALYACEVIGGSGGDADLYPNHYGGQGGNGCMVDGWGVLAVGTIIRGGGGGFNGYLAADGGDGLVVLANAQAQLVDVTILPGYPGCCSGGTPGSATSGDGVFNYHPQQARTLSTLPVTSGVPGALAVGGSSAPLIVRGKPGDQVEVWRTSVPAQAWNSLFAGAWLLDHSLPAQILHGEIGWSGELLLDVPVAALAPGTTHGLEYLQALVHDPQGTQVLTNVLQRAILDCSLLPDCDGDGIFDTCQILASPGLDRNGDSVLDACVAPATWHVDPAAPPGGDGGPGSPFRTLEAAVSAAGERDTVLLADGIYTGAGNKAIYLTRSVTVRSANGPAACVLDIEGAGYGFLAQTQGTHELRFEGLTIERASSSAIRINTVVDVWIEDCVFRDCASFEGGAITVSQGRSRIQDCNFTGNAATLPSSGMGGAIRATGTASVDIVGCAFERNSARLGGAVAASNASQVRLRSCVFEDNTASEAGGALHRSGTGPIQLENCLAKGNSAPLGGVLDLSSNATATLSASTLVGNWAVRGSALHISDSSQARVFNSILWGGQPAGSAVAQLLGTASMEIAYSTLPRNPVPVRVAVTATLIWGAGNLDQDPRFVDPLADWRLSALSPCIDAAHNLLLPQDVFDEDGDSLFAVPLPFDLAGMPRLVDDPAVPDTGVGPGPIADQGAYER